MNKQKHFAHIKCHLFIYLSVFCKHKFGVRQRRETLWGINAIVFFLQESPLNSHRCSLSFAVSQRRRGRDQVAHTLCSVCGGVMPRERITGRQNPTARRSARIEQLWHESCFSCSLQGKGEIVPTDPQTHFLSCRNPPDHLCWLACRDNVVVREKGDLHRWRDLGMHGHGYG